MDTKYSLNEMFVSIQGEGLNLGKPSLFIRFFGCNLKCKFCDSMYAVNPGIFKIKQEREELSFLELRTKIFSFLEKYNNVNNVVFTGGEPLLQEVEEMILEIRNNFERGKELTFEIETNGKVFLLLKDLNILNLLKGKTLLVNVSFKFPKSSGNKNYISDELLTKWKNLPNVYFKFVFDPNNINEIEPILKKLNKEKVLIMPLGDNRNQVIENSKKAIEYCIQNGYRFSPREHILIYDKKRGV